MCHCGIIHDVTCMNFYLNQSIDNNSGRKWATLKRRQEEESFEGTHTDEQCFSLHPVFLRNRTGLLASARSSRDCQLYLCAFERGCWLKGVTGLPDLFVLVIWHNSTTMLRDSI